MMKKNISLNNTLIGGWLTTSSPIVAEAMAICGFDWIAIDMEHGPSDEASVPAIFMALELHGVAPIVRLPSSDPYLARRMLDLGAAGLIVPVAESADSFSAFAAHCHYPTAGRRGVGLSRANRWGKTFESYNLEFEPVLIPQIETKKGAAAAASIAALECVDGLFVGPYDLSADLGAPGNFETEEYSAALSSIHEACKQSRKASGIHQVTPDHGELKKRLAEGYTFVAYGTDMIAMQHAFDGLSNL
jgi:2-keto-3-deoxy-L-rhamnonate aldolase RhmA